MLSYALVNSTKGVANVFQNRENEYIFEYPCNSSYDCTDYLIKLKAGSYRFELLGASEGALPGVVSTYRDKNTDCTTPNYTDNYKSNTYCLQEASRGGAGGYTSGYITFNTNVDIYATIGGEGTYYHKISDYSSDYCYALVNMSEGGYGGGGHASSYPSNAGGGGGQTAIKLAVNDLWHRIMVSGGGGGADNYGGTFKGSDDGSGGAGGNLTAQGFFINGVYYSGYEANSTFGFTFGTGEAAQKSSSLNPNGIQSSSGASDRPGAGAGWFGGFCSHNGNGGAGGGSSWALTEDAIIPEGNIPAHDDFYNLVDSQPYAFSKNSGFLFTDVIFQPGTWQGNGRMIITIFRATTVTNECDQGFGNIANIERSFFMVMIAM